MEGTFNFYLFDSHSVSDFTQFSIGKARLGYAHPFFSRVSARIWAEAGLRIGRNDNSSFDFLLGGYGNDLINNMVPLYGYGFLSIAGDSFAKGLVEIDYEFLPKNHLVLS